MNWGLRIAILYIGFVALILTLVFTSMNNKEDLVSADYYAQELKYQNRIDATNNANLTQASIDVVVSGHDVELNVPAEFNKSDLSGEILFFRPSDAGKDVKVALKPDEGGKQVLHNVGLIHGAYKVQVSWTTGGKSYYRESSVFIP